jgi:hypothetical protein
MTITIIGHFWTRNDSERDCIATSSMRVAISYQESKAERHRRVFGSASKDRRRRTMYMYECCNQEAHQTHVFSSSSLGVGTKALGSDRIQMAIG